MANGYVKNLNTGRFITGQYDHLLVDKTVGTPYKLRKNIFEILDDDSDSDSD